MTTRTIPSTSIRVADPTASVPGDFWLWPNRLTLQAPLVAVLWQVLLARSLRVPLDPFTPLALAAAVWLIYVADHLIDTARQTSTAITEPIRKAFCRRHWEKFLVMAILVAFVLAAGVSRFLWMVAERIGWQISLAVIGYFALIHLTPTTSRREWPRELLVSLIFTVGTFGAVWLTEERKPATILAPGLLFMALCCTNCSLIETWEWAANGKPKEEAPNRLAVWIAGHLAYMGAAIALASVGLMWRSVLPREFALATVLSGTALASLSRLQHRIPIRFVSPAADFALCSPIIGLALTHFTP